MEKLTEDQLEALYQTGERFWLAFSKLCNDSIQHAVDSGVPAEYATAYLSDKTSIYGRKTSPTMNQDLIPAMKPFLSEEWARRQVEAERETIDTSRKAIVARQDQIANALSNLAEIRRLATESAWGL